MPTSSVTARMTARTCESASGVSQEKRASRWSADFSDSVTGRTLVHGFAADVRRQHVRLENKLFRHAHDVLIQNHEIAVLAGRQRAHRLLLEGRIGRPDRDRF